MRTVSPDASRGIRARHFDFSPAARGAALLRLREAGLTHFRTLEALALATKVAWSGVALEVCWSDEPNYLTGYVASPYYGYIRIPDWKPAGAPGGRIFLLDPAVDARDCIHRLRDEWVMIEPPIELRTEPQHG
jgi:6-carboxyhexanoate--CoA ligase